MDKEALQKLSYGLFVTTASDNGKDNGCITNTAVQVASDPDMLSISVNKDNLTHDMILSSGAFNISVLSEDATFELFKHFGFQSGRDVNKFEGYDGCKRSANGIYYLTGGANAYFSVEVKRHEDLGSHTLFLGNITDMQVVSDAKSATYEYYLNNIKPKPEEKQGSATGGKVVWRCKMCGYEYVGDELPDGFTCPLCKHPASDFERVVL